MINKDPNHQHSYDAEGKMICCTQEEKINYLANKQIKKENNEVGCCSTRGPVTKHAEGDGHDHGNEHDHDDEHGDDDGHDHSSSTKSTFQMFLPPIISLALLLIAIALDNWIPQPWFTGWVRIAWYVAAYLPVGFPVLKEAVASMGKREIFSEFLC